MVHLQSVFPQPFDTGSHINRMGYAQTAMIAADISVLENRL
jgi:hypothetical protein